MLITYWQDKIETLRFIHILQSDVAELKALTRDKDVRHGTKMLAEWGIKEVGSLMETLSYFYTEMTRFTK